MRVVPVSVIPAVRLKMGALAAPYVMLWSIPTYLLAGYVVVIGLDVDDERTLGIDQRDGHTDSEYRQ